MEPGRSATESGDRLSDEDASAPSGRSAADHPLPPGPDGLPFLGHTIPVVRDPFGFYDEIANHGDVVRYRVAGRPFTALLHPDYIQRVLVEEPDRFERHLFSDLGFDFAANGVLFTDGERWRRQRRIMQPAFTVERIRSYADTMATIAERTAARWRDGDTIALNRTLSDLALRILSAALFDLEVDPDAEDAVITRAARAINDRAGPARNLTAFLPDRVPTPANRRYARAIRGYRDRIDELIDRRRSAGPSADDLLSILLHAEGPDGATLSRDEVRDNLITFTFAGHETTSLGLTYTFMLLADHEDVARRLRRELEAVLDGETPRFEHVPRLEFTERVITEAMRLYPPAYILFRRATEDAVIGGYRVPEGTILTLPQFRVHLDGRFYDDPEAFRPDRWTDEFRETLPEYAYFPFGGGPRHCIGMRFAMLEMTLVVATLASRFEMTLLSDPDPALSVGATLQPRDDVRVRVHER